MTLIKSLLLGSAAGIVAVATAQAADLPTRKAAPVEYVRVCNVGGITGWTLPGSDTCVKFSGYMTAHFIGGNISNQFNSASAQTAAGALYPGLAAALGDAGGATHLSQRIMVEGGDSQTTAFPGVPFFGTRRAVCLQWLGCPDQFEHPGRRLRYSRCCGWDCSGRDYPGRCSGQREEFDFQSQYNRLEYPRQLRL